MNKLIIAGTITAIGAFATAAYYISIDNDMKNRFPEIDPKIRRKAYRKFLSNSMNNVYGDMDDFDAAKMDQLFLEQVRILTPVK